MKSPARHPAPTLTAPAPRIGGAAGFTLVELIVAVAAVALLTVGIGQIFSSVGRLVGAGTALAETDQFARSIEGQLRQDFEALSQLSAKDTFLVIRNRRVGDLDRSDSLNGSEKAIYLNSDDKEFDRKEGIAPYAKKSRAVTVRLDDMMFLASAGSESATAQRVPPNMDQPGNANHVRLYYGHGLRPPIDSRFNPIDPSAFVGVRTGNVPPRLYFADGDFGDRAGAANRYHPSGAPALFAQTQGRNEFAGDWLLLRQPLLMSGGLVAGSATPPPVGSRPSEWMYTPFIRGLECVERSFTGWGGGGTMDDDTEATPSPPSGLGPYARVLYHGRADICAQNLSDARRWLEGLNPGINVPDDRWIDASAFDGGMLDTAPAMWDPSVDPYPSPLIDAPLWQREGAGSPQINEQTNHRSLISAIAGCLARFQAEDDPPMVERRDVLTTNAAVPAIDAPRPRFQQVMDMHAVVASRVSNFEIAWTDGNTWAYDAPFDRNGDDDPTDSDRDGDYGLTDNLNRGDTIWCDMDFSRYDNPNGGARDLPGADVDNLYNSAAANPRILPEVYPGERRTLLDVTAAFPNRYDAQATGADPDPDGASEYLAVFPFRNLDGVYTPPPATSVAPFVDGARYASPFLKPTRVRVRMTVHDSQFRLPGGRQYEFEFPIDLE